MKKVATLLLVVVATIASAVIVAPYMVYEFKQRDLEGSFSKLRLEADKIASIQLAEISDILENQIDAADTLIGSSKTDHCYKAAKQSGWFTNGAYQKCALRYVLGYYTDLSKDQLQNLLEQNQNLHAVFINMDSSFTNDCAVGPKSFGAAIRYHAAGQTECGIPPNSSPNSFLYNTYSEHTDWSLDRDMVDGSLNQIWIAFEQTYLYKDLGCKGLAFLGCNNLPLDQPFHPKAP